MNVLPLVSAFLLIFAICSYTFVHTVRTAIEAKTHFSGSYRISRKFAIDLASDVYTKHKAENLHPQKKGENETQTKGEYTSPRDWFKKIPESKLNIRPLLEVGDHSRLEKITLTLIQDLYSFAPFYKQDLEKEILTTFLEILKEDKEIIRFDVLLTKIPQEKFTLFYKVIKGTHSYKLHTTLGYPALGDFITLEKTKENPIHFCHASRPLLETVFGPTITPLIINEEKHKWEPDHKHRPMNKQELEAFLLSHQQSPAEYQELFSYGTSKQTCPFDIIHDGEAGLRIKIEK
ncbi:MAG: hypothetical protein K1000chlam3_00867 [Chlamydiae bacterium]|nr:hypothetical protein [Chlamydiota bacterium]